MHLKRKCLALLLCGSLVVCGGAQKAVVAAKGSRSTETVKRSAAEPAPPLGAKVIVYNDREVIRINAKLRYNTLIVLPKTEKILDFTCGDKDYWVINGSENFALVKPAKAGARTNVNLVTARGNVYSFVFVEVSELPDAEPDLKVFVELKDESVISAAGSAPRFVSVQEVDSLRQQLAAAKEETRQAKLACQT